MARAAFFRFLALLGVSLCFAVLADEGTGAASLRARQAQYQERLAHNGFGKPLVLESSESEGQQRGDVYGVVQQPFPVVSTGFREAPGWCDVLILPFNTKHCFAGTSGGEPMIALRIGRKSGQSPEDAYPLNLRFHVDEQSPDYLRVALKGDKGPVGTRDYRIVLEATPLDATRTFIHLSYSYAYGSMSSMMMQLYLSTAGAHKVGFTVAGKDAQGNPQYVGGMRGATERNTMRYFLAIEAYLDSLSAPPEERLEKRLSEWHAAVSRYPTQLHEMDRAEYFTMKHREAARMKQPIG
jgi:hypothetical protein